MTSVLKEIEGLREGKPIIIDYKNSNRYRVVMQEDNGTKTAYYFSAPIYNIHTRKAVELRFKQRNSLAYAVGSNANITVSNEIRLENAEGFCILQPNKALTHISERELRYENDILIPTTNGVLYKSKCKKDEEISFELETGKPFMEIRTNDKYFSLMSMHFRPFVTLSCIGTANATGEIIAPATVVYQKLNDKKYRLSLTPCSPLGEYIWFEFNLYEPKLVQDTTVESQNPKTNNAFGSMAFIGNTKQFGEQWLYSRPDFDKFSELADKHINKAILHLPKYNYSNVELSAFKVASRFCSFGSNWDNKVALSSAISNTTINGNYQNLDITELLTNTKTGYITRSEGYILKSLIKNSGFSAVATADSYYTPQIFEINYK